MDLVRKIADYLRFWVLAGDLHRLHSPFLFEWYKEVVAMPKDFYAFYQIQEIRLQLLHNQKVIQIQDFGAKGQKQAIRTERISQIARRTSVKPKIGEFLFRMVDYFSPKTIVELGTSCGISTLYLSEAAQKNAKMYSLEGSEALLEIAKKNLENKHPIDWILGNIDQNLEKTLEKIEKLDFVFFDANHRYEATMRYFETCLKKAHQDSVFIFDDIYWSAEMKKAWKEICANEKVGFSIDFFEIGVVFFRQKQAKQHFLLKLG